jgi:hypothetical protein
MPKAECAKISDPTGPFARARVGRAEMSPRDGIQKDNVFQYVTEWRGARRGQAAARAQPKSGQDAAKAQPTSANMRPKRGHYAAKARPGCGRRAASPRPRLRGFPARSIPSNGPRDIEGARTQMPAPRRFRTSDPRPPRASAEASAVQPTVSPGSDVRAWRAFTTRGAGAQGHDGADRDEGSEKNTHEGISFAGWDGRRDPDRTWEHKHRSRRARRNRASIWNGWKTAGRAGSPRPVP